MASPIFFHRWSRCLTGESEAFHEYHLDRGTFGALFLTEPKRPTAWKTQPRTQHRISSVASTAMFLFYGTHGEKTARTEMEDTAGRETLEQQIRDKLKVSILGLVAKTSTTTTSAQQDEWASLALAAEAGDEIGFLRVAKRLDWSELNVTDFVRTMKLALKAGAHLAARNLAVAGAKRFPQSEELQRMAFVLGPARIVQTDVPPDPSRKGDQEWLRVHSQDYKGKWVAILDGQLIALGNTAREVKAQLKSSEGVLITRVA